MVRSFYGCAFFAAPSEVATSDVGAPETQKRAQVRFGSRLCKKVFTQPRSFASNLAWPRHVRLGGDLGNAGCPVLPVEAVGLDAIQAPMAFKAERAEISHAAK